MDPVLRFVRSRADGFHWAPRDRNRGRGLGYEEPRVAYLDRWRARHPRAKLRRMENGAKPTEVSGPPPLWKGGRAFLYSALGWGVLGTFWATRVETNQGTTALRGGVFLIFWALSLLNLIFLGKTLENLFHWMHPATVEPLEKSRRLFGMALSGILKFATLGVIIWGLVQYPYSFKWSLVLGLGTLIIVPLAGGWIWFRKASFGP